MTGYPLYLLTRLGQFALVVFIGINIAFVVTHATPIDPVEQSIAAATQYGTTNPEAIEMMRRSRFDIVLVDLHMTPVSGMEVVAGALEANKEAIVIVITGNPSVATSIEAMLTTNPIFIQ